MKTVVAKTRNSRIFNSTGTGQGAIWDSIQHWYTNITCHKLFDVSPRACALCGFYRPGCHNCPLYQHKGQSCYVSSSLYHQAFCPREWGCYTIRLKGAQKLLDTLIEIYVLKYGESVRCGDYIYELV
ncbi:MAG: hypothetical protein KAS32_24875 [Candidatus Peribacteraceae bacterium]|nr:hypothetical protein [Candidatus Peribacteraceae bacterium]